MNLIHNERIKLFATYLNGLAIAIFAVGALAPSFSMLYGTLPNSGSSFTAVTPICVIVSAALHYAGSIALRRLRP